MLIGGWSQSLPVHVIHGVRIHLISKQKPPYFYVPGGQGAPAYSYSIVVPSSWLRAELMAATFSVIHPASPPQSGNIWLTYDVSNRELNFTAEVEAKSAIRQVSFMM